MKLPEGWPTREMVSVGAHSIAKWIHGDVPTDESRYRKSARSAFINMLEAAPTPPAQSPIPMILHCPACRAQHIDEGEWATKPHRSHECQSCGHIWRPADVATVGVETIQTKGERDSTPPVQERLSRSNLVECISGAISTHIKEPMIQRQVLDAAEHIVANYVTPPAQPAMCLLFDTDIERIALENGFKLKEQPDGRMALNPYVYHFARKLLAAADARPEGERNVCVSPAQNYGDCGNSKCNWRGSLDDCSYLGAVGPCCPRCREIVEPDPTTPPAQEDEQVPDEVPHGGKG